MKKTSQLSILVISISLLVPVFAQFKSQLKEKNLGRPQESTVSIEEMERFSMNQGFSLSMASTGGQSFSYGIYSNKLRYLISDKWSLHTRFDLVQPTHSSIPRGVSTFNGEVFYGANLLYQPSKNLQLSITLDNYPRFYRYRPFLQYGE